MADATLPKRAHDTLTYHRADGTDVEFGPAADGFKPANQPVLRVLLDRGKPDGSLGEWLPLTPAPVPAPVPAPAPVPPPVVVVPLPPVVVVVDPPPPVRPSPPPKPVLPRVDVVEPAADLPAAARPEGPWNRSLADVHVRGYTQNVVQMKPADRAYTNVRCTDALRNLPAHVNAGQGVYAEHGRHTFRGYLAARNGWRPTADAAARARERRNDRCHGIYANVGTAVDGEDLLLVGNGWAGAQLRGRSRLRRVVCVGNAVGLACLFGPHDWAEVTVYDGGYVESGADWAGNTGLYVWSPTTIRDVWLVGAPDPQPPYPHPRPGGGRRAYDGGAVKLDWHHGQYPTCPDPTLDARDCVVAGWRPSTVLLERTGQASVFDSYDGQGFVVKPDPVRYDWRPVVDAVERNEISIREAVRTLTDGIRGLVR